LLVAEIVVDARAYSDGYNVQVLSVVRDPPDIAPAQPASDDAPVSLAPLSPESNVLPVVCNVYSLPASPLYSSSDRAPSRHLLRFTLPTARYDTSPLDDPLTGEHHIPPPKPAWLTKLESTGAIVEVIVRPATALTPALSTSTSKKSRNMVNVFVNDKQVVVVSEKDSMNLLGRRELEDDRLRALPMLSRVPLTPEVNVIPQSMTKPVAIASNLIIDVTASSTNTAMLDEAGSGPGSKTGNGSTKLQDDQRPEPVQSKSSGLFNYFNAYSDWLGSSTSTSRGSKHDPGAIASSGKRSSSKTASKSRKDSRKSEVKNDTAEEGTPPLVIQQVRAPRTYSLSTVLIVALIFLLVGSLLRSLISPADFVYFRPSNSQDEMDHEDGWREIKRIFEVKYMIGGWDFVVAAVRRH